MGMVTLFHMLDTSWINGNTIWCLKRKEDISKFLSYDFGLNIAKASGQLYVRRRKSHGLTSMVQLRIASPKYRKQIQAKGKDVKCTRIIVEVKVGKVIQPNLFKRPFL